MEDFNNLEIQDSKKTKPIKEKVKLEYVKKSNTFIGNVLIHKGNNPNLLDFNDLLEESPSQIPQGRYKVVPPVKGEPGTHVPVAAFPQIGQICDVCGDMHTHVYNDKTKQIMCLYCRTKRNTQ